MLRYPSAHVGGLPAADAVPQYQGERQWTRTFSPYRFRGPVVQIEGVGETTPQDTFGITVDIVVQLVNTLPARGKVFAQAGTTSFYRGHSKRQR
ncbi:MAG: hypothetical protein RMK92_04495 [Armatimonadota bacterium]|nr:hypothetical protein [Armatimonadota bacterium]